MRQTRWITCTDENGHEVPVRMLLTDDGEIAAVAAHLTGRPAGMWQAMLGASAMVIPDPCSLVEMDAVIDHKAREWQADWAMPAAPGDDHDT